MPRPSYHRAPDAHSASSPITGGWRIVLALLQGLLLYGLHQSWRVQAWPASSTALFVPCVMLALYLPLMAMVSLGQLRRRPFVIWLALLAGLLVALGSYDAWRADLTSYGAIICCAKTTLPPPSQALIACVALGLFMAQAMVLAGHHDGKYLASYPSYFDAAWKLLIQLGFASLFCMLFWGLLALGNALFMLIGIDYLDRLMDQRWFSLPLTTLSFAVAWHLSEARPHLVADIRRWLLTWLSWLLPMALLIVGLFLLGLLVTGLDSLWQTRHAASLLLAACAVLIVLINTAYQDGEPFQQDKRFIARCGRWASLLPLPLAVIAIYSLYLRVADHGWTPHRVTAAACMLVAMLYALGYFAAAMQRKAPMRLLAAVNVFTSLAILLILVSLLSPLTDPARITVSSQLKRLAQQQVDAKMVDFQLLRFESARYGLDALMKLRHHAEGPHAQSIRDQANHALQMQAPWQDAAVGNATRLDRRKNLRAHPSQRTLPDSFLAQPWQDNEERRSLPACLTQAGKQCDVFFVRPDLRAAEQLLVYDVSARATLFAVDAQGQWVRVGAVEVPPTCQEELRHALEQGTLNWRMVQEPELDINGVRLRWHADRTQPVGCRKPATQK